MAAAAAAMLLDELMGRDRNLAPTEKRREVRWDDPETCKYFLCGFCPHELFVNTRADLGPCDKIHDEELKKSYQKSSRFERIGYEEEFMRFLQSLLADVERRIKRGHARLALNSAQGGMSGGLPGTKEDQIEIITTRINELVEEAEELGCQGKVEEAQGIMRLSDQLREERTNLEQVDKKGKSRDEEMAKKMEVCNVCGALLVAGDAQQRIDEHIMGKQHMGYARIRSYIEQRHMNSTQTTLLPKATAEMGVKIPEFTEEKERPEKERTEKEPEKRRRDDDRDRDRDRDRRRRSRSSSRSRRRRSRSRSRSRRDRDRDRGRDRDRDRDHDRKDRSRDRRRRSRSRDRDRKRSRSRSRHRSHSKSRSRRSSRDRDRRRSRSRSKGRRSRDRSRSRDRKDRDRRSARSSREKERDSDKRDSSERSRPNGRDDSYHHHHHHHHHHHEAGHGDGDTASAEGMSDNGLAKSDDLTTNTSHRNPGPPETEVGLLDKHAAEGVSQSPSSLWEAVGCASGEDSSTAAEPPNT